MTYHDEIRPQNPSTVSIAGEAPPNPATYAEAAKAIGRVVSVSGAQAVVRLGGAPGQEGTDDLNAIQIGSLVKMRSADTTVFGMVRRLDIPDLSTPDDGTETRITEIEFVGEGVAPAEGRPLEFKRGVSFYPKLDDAVYATSQEDLMRVYAQPAVASAKVGTINQDQSLPAFISVDDLLGKHFAVLGNTGAGKSCAVATILRSIISNHPEGHMLLLDLHDEYSHGFRDCAEIISPDQMKLPYWILNLEELQEIVVEKSEYQEIDKNILKDAVSHAKRVFNESEGSSEDYSGDSPVPYRLSELLHFIEVSLGKLDKPTDSAPYMRLRSRINSFVADKRFQFMFEERFTVPDDMAKILSRLFRVPAEGKPITILDLSEVPTDILKVVVSLLCRLTFDFAFWADRDTPVLLICEEAHRYAARIDDRGFEMTKRALSRIANEGRKYGVSLGIVSQRPSELELGILSQCNTVFAMRMSNQRDQDFVRGTLSESALGLLDSLPSLRTGEAVAAGEGLSLPVRLHFDYLPEDQRPVSGTARFSDSWKVSTEKDGYVTEIVQRWRRQRR